MLEGILSFLHIHFSLHLFNFTFTWFFSICALEFALSMHRQRWGSLHQFTKMNLQLLLLSVSLHSSVCSLRYCQIRQNIEETLQVSGDTLGENTFFGIDHHHGKKTGENWEGKQVPEITPNCLSGGRGATPEVISNLEKNKSILRVRHSGHGKPASGGWLEARGAAGREQSSPPRSPVSSTNHTCVGRGVWHIAGSTTWQEWAGSPAWLQSFPLPATLAGELGTAYI